MPRYERNYTVEKRTEFLGFQLTPSERRQIEDAAKEAGSTLSEWARDLLLARSATAAMLRAQRRNPEAKAIMDALNAAGGELNAIGNNLNQIARHLNATGELRDWSELRKPSPCSRRARRSTSRRSSACWRCEPHVWGCNGAQPLAKVSGGAAWCGIPAPNLLRFAMLRRSPCNQPSRAKSRRAHLCITCGNAGGGREGKNYRSCMLLSPPLAWYD